MAPQHPDDEDTLADGDSNVAFDPSPRMVSPDALCPNCGATRVPGAKFCPHCGNSFTGAARAQGAAQRPLATLDIEALEGVKHAVAQVRPRTATGANSDEPAALAGMDAPVGLGVTLLPPALVSDASRPDEPDAFGGQKPVTAPVAAAHLDAPTEPMARADDPGALAARKPAGPSNGANHGPHANGARAPAPLPAPIAFAAPAARPRSSGDTTLAAPRGAPIASIEALERPLDKLLTAPGALVDDEGMLQNVPGFRIGLTATHMAALLADAALVDDPAMLAGGKPHAIILPRAILHHAAGAFARTDDPNVLAPPTLELPPVPASPAAGKGANLSRDWADVAERPIPRKDDRANVDLVPRSREIFLPPEELPPAPPPPEPVVAYVPAPPAPAAVVAPWAAIPTAAPAPPPKKGISPTMVMNLDAVEQRALLERLIQKDALTNDDVDAAKKPKK